MLRPVAILAALAFASGASAASAQSVAHNGWQCSVEGKWMEVYYDLPAPEMKDGFALETAGARPIRLKYSALVGESALNSYAAFSLQLDEALKINEGGQRYGVYIYDIEQDGTKVVSGSTEQGIEELRPLMIALRTPAKGDLTIVLKGSSMAGGGTVRYGRMTLPVDGFMSAGQAAAELMRKPRAADVTEFCA